MILDVIILESLCDFGCDNIHEYYHKLDIVSNIIKYIIDKELGTVC